MTMLNGGQYAPAGNVGRHKWSYKVMRAAQERRTGVCVATTG